MTTTQPAGRIAVLGAGVMGRGVATLAVGRGVPVLLVDVDEDALAGAPGSVASQLRMARLMKALPAGTPAAPLTTSTAVAEVAGAAAVIESVTERPVLKAAVLAQITAAVRPGTPVLTNTSAIPVDELAAATGRPGDLVGAHFMNPPYLIRTVEVIRGPRTSDATMAATLALLSTLDRVGVVVGDGPGFVINRILQRVINEAARVVEEGIAAPATVDELFVGCLGHRTGPLATADLIGLDNVVDSLAVLRERTGDDRYRPCDLLLAKVSAGELGRKTGRGFYEHERALW